jgi:hypothetical protein
MNAAPDALLLVAPGCAHCAALLEAAGALVKAGAIGRLEVVDLAAHPEAGEAYGVRSVPWLRLGSLRFDGAMSAGELRRWAAEAVRPRGMAAYFLEMLRTGRRRHVEALMREAPARGSALVELLEDPQASMAVRLGIGAVLESLQGSGACAPLLPGLARLAREADARLRADACHFLALIGDPAARPVFEACLADADAQVREIAAEALQALRA